MRAFRFISDSGPIAGLALIAFAGSFTHIASLARTSGQEGPMAWAVAVCVDLLCVVAAQEIRRDRRLGRSSAVPVLVLGVGVLLTLAANLADAQATVWGRVCAGVPAGAFLLAMALLERRGSVQEEESAGQDHVEVDLNSGRTGQSEPVDDTLLRAQQAAEAYRQEHGKPITRDALRTALGVSNGAASALLKELRELKAVGA